MSDNLYETLVVEPPTIRLLIFFKEPSRILSNVALSKSASGMNQNTKRSHTLGVILPLHSPSESMTVCVKSHKISSPPYSIFVMTTMTGG